VVFKRTKQQMVLYIGTKKSKKKMKKALDIYSALFVSLGMKINKKRNNL
tara:strand:+ start:1455 stop:1601 length:147 start_codon:yes stop_codon:yes gene_type:complete